jgi:hypothetical protein
VTIFLTLAFKYLGRRSGNRRTAGEARALDDAKLPRAAKASAEFGRAMSRTAPSRLFLDSLIHHSRILLNLFACCYESCGVFIAHSPAFEKTSCNKDAADRINTRSTSNGIPVISKHGYLKLWAFQFLHAS